VAKVLAGEEKLVPFELYFWECRLASLDTLSNSIFEFVGIETPKIGVKQTDGETLRNKLLDHKVSCDTVQFMTTS
jgi:hypothetical protein